MSLSSVLSDAPILEQEWREESNHLENGYWHSNSSAHPNGINREAEESTGLWGPTIQKIVELQHLKDDWDGLGAKAPERDLLESAIGLALVFSEKGLPPPQSVVPGLNGWVNFEWQEQDGTIAEAIVDRPLHAEVMVIEAGKSPVFFDLPSN